MIKSDKWIKKMSLQNRMINPFCETLEYSNTLSYGLSSYGYDIRLADDMKLFGNHSASKIDPKDFDNKILVPLESRLSLTGEKYFDLPPHSFALGRSVETLKIPRDTLVICIGKSTYVDAD